MVVNSKDFSADGVLFFYRIRPASEEESADGQDPVVSGIFADADALPCIGGVDDPVVAQVDGDVAAVADDITGKGLGEAGDLCAALADRGVVVGELDPEVVVDGHDEAGAVGAFGQAGAAPPVGVADVFEGKVRDLLAFWILQRG